MTHDIHEDFADNAIPTWYIDTNQPNLGTLIKILLPLKMSNGKVGYVLEISSATTGTLSAIQQHFTNILILFIVLGLLIISSVYLLIYVQILKPLNSLTKATKIVSDGNLTYKLEINSKDELGILAKAFNSMTLRLNASQFELEEKVKKRTAELEQAKLLNSKFGEQSKLANELEAVKKQLEEHKQEKEQLSKQVDEKDVEITRLKEENDNLKNKI
jgi:nitrate/nitrite-specific signal transduction histidine kinase